jgi:hypothetical protein
LVALGTYLVDTRVNKEVSAVNAQSAALNARLDALTKEVDTKTAGLAKEVDAKYAGLAKELDAKNAGLAREVDAKVAGVIAGAAMKAEAETLRVLKEYKVRARAGGFSAPRDQQPATPPTPFHLPPPTPNPPSPFLSFSPTGTRADLCCWWRG